MSYNRRGAYIFLFVLALNGVTLNAQTKTQRGYRVLKHYKLGGEGGWDYLTILPSFMKTRRTSSRLSRTLRYRGAHAL